MKELAALKPVASSLALEEASKDIAEDSDEDADEKSENNEMTEDVNTISVLESNAISAVILGLLFDLNLAAGTQNSLSAAAASSRPR